MVDNKLPYSLEVYFGAVTITISGLMDAKALKSKNLNSDDVKEFIAKSTECNEYLRMWDFANLMKIRSTLNAFLISMFPAFSVDRLRLQWLSGADILDLG